MINVGHKKGSSVLEFILYIRAPRFMQTSMSVI